MRRALMLNSMRCHQGALLCHHSKSNGGRKWSVDPSETVSSTILFCFHFSRVVSTVTKGQLAQTHQWAFVWLSWKDQVLSTIMWASAFSFLTSVPHPFLLPLLLSTYSFLLCWDSFFFLASIPGWKCFRSRLLHAISLKIIRVKLLAEVLALEEPQLFKVGKVLCGSVLGFQVTWFSETGLAGGQTQTNGNKWPSDSWVSADIKVGIMAGKVFEQTSKSHDP